MKIYEIIKEARTPIEKEYDLPKLKKDPVDDAERYGLEHDQPYDLNTGPIEARDFIRLILPILSKKEKTVLALELQGMREDEIAKELNIKIIDVRKIRAVTIRKIRHWARSQDTGFERDPTAWFESLLKEAKLGTSPKRPSRAGSRPDRGHEPVNGYKNKEVTTIEDQELSERGKASRRLCLSARPDSELGASQLSSCKSQGLRARDGEKSHKIGKGPHGRIKVGGKKIRGHKYGGPLPDWS